MKNIDKGGSSQFKPASCNIRISSLCTLPTATWSWKSMQLQARYAYCMAMGLSRSVIIVKSKGTLIIVRLAIRSEWRFALKKMAELAWVHLARIMASNLFCLSQGLKDYKNL